MEDMKARIEKLEAEVKELKESVSLLLKHSPSESKRHLDATRRLVHGRKVSTYQDGSTHFD